MLNAMGSWWNRFCENEAIAEVQQRALAAYSDEYQHWGTRQGRTGEDESERLVGKARGDHEYNWVAYGVLKDGSLGVATKDNPLARMRVPHFPAPWCPKPWSKSKGVRA